MYMREITVDLDKKKFLEANKHSSKMWLLDSIEELRDFFTSVKMNSNNTAGVENANVPGVGFVERYEFLISARAVANGEVLIFDSAGNFINTTQYLRQLQETAESL